MAEAFGIFAGAASLLSLFTPCMDAFECIQFGRNFGRDYETCQLRLDIIRLRLLRWGVSLGFTGGETEQASQQIHVSARDQRLVKLILEHMTRALDEAESASQAFKTRAERTQSSSLVVHDPNRDLEEDFRALHETACGMALRRQQGTSFLQKAKWALYEKQNFDDLVKELTENMNSLEGLFESNSRYSERLENLRREQVSEIREGASLRLLADISRMDDPLMAQSAREALNPGTSHYEKVEICLEESGNTHVGKHVVARGGINSNINGGYTRFNSIKISGSGSSHIGDTYDFYHD